MILDAVLVLLQTSNEAARKDELHNKLQSKSSTKEQGSETEATKVPNKETKQEVKVLCC